MRAVREIERLKDTLKQKQMEITNIWKFRMGIWYLLAGEYILLLNMRKI